MTLISVTYSATVIAVYSFVSRGRQADPAIEWSWAAGGGTLLYWILLGIFYVGWRVLWWCLPELNRWMFPDLNGKWKVTISYCYNGIHGQVVALAQIKQTLLSLAIHLESDGSESDTLAVVPKKDPQGRPCLHYLYRNAPKHVDGQNRSSYEGSATLKLDHDKLHRLSGNYFTEVNSKGRFDFTRGARTRRSIMLGRAAFGILVILILGILGFLFHAELGRALDSFLNR